MIQEFVNRFMAGKAQLESLFKQSHPEDYKQIVQRVVSVIADPTGYDQPSQERVHQIDDGDYQGTLVFVIGASGYQPSDYWYVKVGYGSCSGCDTLEAIRDYSDLPPSDSQVQDYMTLALHVVQGIKKMGDEVV